ncbi:MAG: fibronectin type III domain-containing protein [Bacteroidales bacterium]|nr:fibronectin type III domain-containing protein [Bacteroidales bacterium]
MKKIITLLAICSLVSTAFSCGKETLVESYEVDLSDIKLNSSDVLVEYTTAKVFGDIRVDHNPARITEVRVCYGTASDDLSKNVKAAYDTENGYSADIPSLEDGTQYFYRVDIMVGRTPIEGKVQDFITFPMGPVDLDLPSGNKWMSHNVGAKTPTESGGYYAWAELTEKKQYDWSSYKYCNGSYNKLTKYTFKTNYSYDGTLDNMVELQAEDDVATQLLGEHYSVPSYKDWQELMDNCVLTKATINGRMGYKVSSKVDMNNNKKFIFLSGENGYYDGTSRHAGASYYWSATLKTTQNDVVLNIRVGSLGLQNDHGSRCFGETVRAVYK